MNKDEKMDKEEIEREIDEFLEHREEIKKIIGNIGGKPTKNVKFINTIFFILLILSFTIPIFVESIPHIVALDLGLLLISIKIIYSLMQQARVNHYQFWILATLEWRLHDLTSDIKNIRNNLENNNE